MDTNQPGRSRVRVLGVDPGFDRLGLAVIEGDASRPSLIWSTCVKPPKGSAPYRLAEVHTAISKAVTDFAPTVLAIETLFFSTNRKTAMSVAEARGVILAAAGLTGVTVVEFSPAQVKLAVTGSGSADKAAIARMVPRLVSLPVGRRSDDELDAIAIAIAGLAVGKHHR